MKTQYRNLFFSMALTVVLFSLAAPVTGRAAVEDVVAVVNEIPITRQDVIQETAIIAADIHLQNLPWTQEQISEFSAQVAETLIDRELLYQQARQRDIKIQPQWIERALLDLKDKAGSAADFEAYLTDTGLSELKLKERIKTGLIIRRLLRRSVLHRIRVSEAEMQAFYNDHPDYLIRQDQIRAQQIFIAAPAKGDVSQRADALRRIQAIKNRLMEANADFATLALEYSEDPSKTRGGDLGYLERTQLIPVFAEAAFALQPSEISDIIETRLGYHLIKMVDRIPSSPMAYRNARTKIESTLRRNKENAAVGAYLKKLRSQAAIKR